MKVLKLQSPPTLDMEQTRRHCSLIRTYIHAY